MQPIDYSTLMFKVKKYRLGSLISIIERVPIKILQHAIVPEYTHTEHKIVGVLYSPVRPAGLSVTFPLKHENSKLDLAIRIPTKFEITLFTASDQPNNIFYHFC